MFRNQVHTNDIDAFLMYELEKLRAWYSYYA